MLAMVPVLLGIRIEFLLFAGVLICVALFHKKTMEIALGGLLILLFVTLIFDDGFNLWEHFVGHNPILQQIVHKDLRQGEWALLLNLLGLLLGFAVLAKLFEQSKVPDMLPAILPDDWKGGLALLAMVFVLSAFLDNIAAAMIGGTVAMVVFKQKLHLGYLAAIIAASNAGGAGSVIGDTTTTLMWIDGVHPLAVTHAWVASIIAFVFFGVAASRQQDAFHHIRKDPPKRIKIDHVAIILVIAMLVLTVLTNYLFDFPALGVWIVITLGSVFYTMPWKVIQGAFKGSVFLLSLVICASMMPVNELPPASLWSAFAFGFVSAVFDNIPLTKLCLDQGGYDWGVLAYSVGFGGSMIWFGSSAGVALSGIFPALKNTGNYLKSSWHIPLGFVIGYFGLIALLGWHPQPAHKGYDKPNTEQELILKKKEVTSMNTFPNGDEKK